MRKEFTNKVGLKKTKQTVKTGGGPLCRCLKKVRTSNNERLFIYLSTAKSDDEKNAAFINSNETEKHMPASQQTNAEKG